VTSVEGGDMSSYKSNASSWLFSNLRLCKNSDRSVAIGREILSTIKFKESCSLENVHGFIHCTNNCCYVPKCNDPYLLAPSIEANYFLQRQFLTYSTSERTDVKSTTYKLQALCLRSLIIKLTRNGDLHCQSFEHI